MPGMAPVPGAFTGKPGMASVPRAFTGHARVPGLWWGTGYTRVYQGPVYNYPGPGSIGPMSGKRGRGCSQKCVIVLPADLCAEHHPPRLHGVRERLRMDVRL